MSAPKRSTLQELVAALPDEVRGGRPADSTPAKLVVDSSSDGERAAYAGLLLMPGRKPHLLQGTGRGIESGSADSWGTGQLVYRVLPRLQVGLPLLVFTDSAHLAATQGDARIAYRWISRNDPLLVHMHGIANRLRLDMPVRAKAAPKHSGKPKAAKIPVVPVVNRAVHAAPLPVAVPAATPASRPGQAQSVGVAIRVEGTIETQAPSSVARTLRSPRRSAWLSEFVLLVGCAGLLSTVMVMLILWLQDGIRQAVCH